MLTLYICQLHKCGVCSWLVLLEGISYELLSVLPAVRVLCNVVPSLVTRFFSHTFFLAFSHRLPQRVVNTIACFSVPFTYAFFSPSVFFLLCPGTVVPHQHHGPSPCRAGRGLLGHPNTPSDPNRG